MTSRFTGPSPRELVAVHADSDEREQEAVRAAQERRAATNSASSDEETADTIWVDSGGLDLIENYGSIVVFTGMDEQGHAVRFGVDHRPALDLIETLLAEGEIPCAVESWQILSRTEAPLV